MIGCHLNHPFRNSAELQRLMNPSIDLGPFFSEEMSASSAMEADHNALDGGGNPAARPTVLYMLTTGFTVDWNRVSSHLASHPNEAAVRDRNGFSTLHHALARRDSAPVDVVRALINADPAAVMARTNTGMTPLSIACWRRADIEVLNALLEAEPSMANVPDRKGAYPLHAMWESYRNSFPQRESVWPHICALLRASYRGSCDDGDMDGGGILHAAAGSPWCCPLPVLRIAINRHRSQLQLRDARGRLPLHVAAECSPNRPPPLPQGVAEEAVWLLDEERAPAGTGDQGENDISLLLRSYPDAALLRDGNERRPFFLAVASGRNWHQGIETFLESHPIELQSRDNPSGLFPFQFAAAVGAAANVDVVFQLLKAAPHLIGVQDGL